MARSGYFECFGSPIHVQGSVQQPWRFSGQYHDEETGLHYNRARYYSPSLGRYISRDPLEFAAGLNFYVYADNDPVDGVDTLGLDGLSGWMKAIAVGALVVVGAALVVAALPVIATAAATATVTSAVLFAAADVVAGTTIIGVGAGLGVAPDGCAECQAQSMLKYGVQGFGAGLAAIGMMLGLPAMTGAGGMALAGGGVLASDAALGSAAAVAGGYVMMSQASKMDGGGGGSGDSQKPESKPKRISNPKHNQNSSSPEPKNVDDLYEKSIDDPSKPNGTRWAQDEDGTIHRFSKPSNGETHWNGSTAADKPISPNDIPNGVKKAFK